MYSGKLKLLNILNQPPMLKNPTVFFLCQNTTEIFLVAKYSVRPYYWRKFLYFLRHLLFYLLTSATSISSDSGQYGLVVKMYVFESTGTFPDVLNLSDPSVGVSMKFMNSNEANKQSLF